MPETIHYLDNSATTRPRPEVVAAMMSALTEDFGNPSSAHRLGIAAEKRIQEARAAVARLIGARPEEIHFTSGGTEAINTAIFGVARAYGRRGRHIITQATEHPATLEACRALAAGGFEVTILPVDRSGRVDPDQVARALRPDTILVTLMAVNNEIGTIQPVAEVGRLLRGRETLFHVDAVQAAGKLPLRVDEIGCHLLSLSGHKIHGPKGVGALYVRQGVRIAPLLYGGGQEEGLRSGTENVPGIVGLGTAAALALAELDQVPDRLRALKRRLLAGLAERGLEYVVNGPDPEEAAPHILNLSFRGVPRGEVLLHALEQQGVFVSTGSACHSRRQTLSHVLEALRLPPEQATGAIRVSLSPLTTEADIDAFVAAAAQAVPELRNLMR
ncbi:MAG: cysteine desulfurase [Firmicutes bacterium]|nr:cysteine desulfurase [Bacillota bacterium]